MGDERAAAALLFSGSDFNESLITDRCTVAVRYRSCFGGSVGLCSTVPIPNKEAFDEQITVKDSHESYVLKKNHIFSFVFLFFAKVGKAFF